MPFRQLIPGAAGAALVVALLTGCDAANTDNSGETGAETAPATATVAAQDLPHVTMYKNPSCACCGEWAEHMRESGFRVDIEEGRSPGQVKAQHGIPIGLASCHTALVGDYVLEGHVPADVVKQLVKERPDIRGLAVPGMPAGVPGMPDPGPNRGPYEILAIQHDGSARLYAAR